MGAPCGRQPKPPNAWLPECPSETHPILQVCYADELRGCYEAGAWGQAEPGCQHLAAPRHRRFQAVRCVDEAGEEYTWGDTGAFAWRTPRRPPPDVDGAAYFREQTGC